jgi:hypothetical protein
LRLVTEPGSGTIVRKVTRSQACSRTNRLAGLRRPGPDLTRTHGNGGKPMKHNSCTFINAHHCSADIWTLIREVLDEACLSDLFEALIAGMMIGSCTMHAHQRNFVVCSYLFVLLTIPNTSGHQSSIEFTSSLSSSTPIVPYLKNSRQNSKPFPHFALANSELPHAQFGPLRLRGFGPKQGKGGGKKGPAKAAKPAAAAAGEAAGKAQHPRHPRRSPHHAPRIPKGDPRHTTQWAQTPQEEDTLQPSSRRGPLIPDPSRP